MMNIPAQLDQLEARKTLRPGSVLDGRFMILRLLGRGGLSSVYKAVDLRTDALVALKVQDVSWQNTALTSITMRALFCHEARMLRRLRQAPIAQYYTAQLDHAPYYFAVDYIDGITLAALLDQVALTRGTAIELSLAVAGAVEQLHAHRPRVVHGDLKPENIYITADGEVIIIDFGTARWLDLDLPDLPLMLSEAYAAPEQRIGAYVDQRADQYALGLIVEAILGEAHSSDLIRTVIERANAVLPLQRYSSVAEFRTALQMAAQPSRMPLSNELWWLSVLVVVVVFLLLLFLFSTGHF